jgi:hypothetical protein
MFKPPIIDLVKVGDVWMTPWESEAQHELHNTSRTSSDESGEVVLSEPQELDDGLEVLPD